MITSVQWEGGIDGELTLGLDQEIVKIDRPGDLVATMMEQSCEPDLQASALIYGYCLATQGVQLPHLVRQVLKKTGPFLRSVSMESMALYRAIEHFGQFVQDHPGEGDELREAVLAESTRYHQELASS
ncbi:MAG: hypothetical protein VX764_07085 [Planctomycetota bacterium]|nr:hypothetical protein [Planctomycetota bacterium]